MKETVIKTESQRQIHVYLAGRQEQRGCRASGTDSGEKEKLMYHDDLLNHTLRWVFGYCYLWNQQGMQFAPGSREFDDFVYRVHTKVWNYLHGRQTLDASCSDPECAIAMEARALFRDFVKAD